MSKAVTTSRLWADVPDDERLNTRLGIPEDPPGGRCKAAVRCQSWDYGGARIIGYPYILFKHCALTVTEGVDFCVWHGGPMKHPNRRKYPRRRLGG